MRYEIRFESRAWKALRKLDEKTRGRLEDAIAALADNPRPQGCKKLVGCHNSFRIRVGDYRVIYEIRARVLLVLVLWVAHRREAYRGI